MTDETDRFDRLEAELVQLKADRQRDAAQKDAVQALGIGQPPKLSQRASEQLQRQDAERAERAKAKADDDEAYKLRLERNRPQREKLAQMISALEARQAGEQARHAQAMQELGAEVPPLRKQLAALELYEFPNADEVTRRQTARAPVPTRRRGGVRALAKLAPGALR
jgi:hypothetical protein